MRETIELMASTEKVINDALREALREQNASTALEIFLEHLGRKSHSERIYIFEGKQGFAVNGLFLWWHFCR